MDTSLSPLEEEYRERMLAVLMRVDPQKPEKGLTILLQRARDKMQAENISHKQALEEIYQGVLERTELRIKLLDSCKLKEK